MKASQSPNPSSAYPWVRPSSELACERMVSSQAVTNTGSAVASYSHCRPSVRVFHDAQQRVAEFLHRIGAGADRHADDVHPPPGFHRDEVHVHFDRTLRVCQLNAPDAAKDHIPSLGRKPSLPGQPGSEQFGQGRDGVCHFDVASGASISGIASVCGELVFDFAERRRSQ